jgi:hypothetical protein
MAYNLAAFPLPGYDGIGGAAAGALAGIGWVGLSIGILGIRGRSGSTCDQQRYFQVSFVVMGVILGAWR